MRVIKPFVSILAFTLLTIQPPAIAAGYLTQVKTEKVSVAERFWSSFWEVVAGRRQLNADLTVKVTDEDGRPLAGASVMVGTAPGNPFEGNVAQTGADGLAMFTHEALRGSIHYPVTAAKSDFTTFTLFESGDNQLEIALQSFQRERDFGFLQGKVNGFPPGYGSNILEMGLFIPAFRPDTLLNFDPGLFVSSYKVKIDVYGERDVPGNVVMPTQRKRWGLIPINISKPEFIMPLPKGFTAHMSAIVGAVPISEAVSLIRNDDFLGALNLATFTHIGHTSRRVEVRGNESFDVNARHEIAQGAFTARMSGIPAKTDMVAISMYDPLGDRADSVTMDIKAVKSEEVSRGNAQVKLGALKRRQPSDNFYVFAGLFDRTQIKGKENTDGYRWVVGQSKHVTGSRRSVPAFRSFLKSMRPSGVSRNNREFRFSSAATSDLAPEYMIVNIVSEKDNDLTKGKTRNILWTAFVQGSVTTLSLPDLGRPVLPRPDTGKNEKFSWEVIALKTRPGLRAPTVDLQSILRNTEHVSSFSKAF